MDVLSLEGESMKVLCVVCHGYCCIFFNVWKLEQKYTKHTCIKWSVMSAFLLKTPV